MAPMTKTLVLAALTAMVSSRPLIAREPSPYMVTVTDWTTLDVYVTQWVDQAGNAISTEVPGGNFAAVSTTPHAVPTVTSTATPVAVTPVVPASPSTTMVTTTSLVVQQPPQPAATLTTITTPVPVAASPSSPAPMASSPAPVSSSSPASGGSSGDSGTRSVAGSSTADCQGQGDACQGDITYYEGGLGACGWNVNTNSDMQIALPYEFMGTQSNGNPYCGKSLTIMNPTTGQTVQATVGDKCMGCTGRSIDLTQVLFNAIGNGCDGRCSGFDWWFN